MKVENNCIGLEFRGHCRERALLGLDDCGDCKNRSFRELDGYEHCGECKGIAPIKALCKGCKEYFLYPDALCNQNFPKYCKKCERGTSD